MAFFTDIHISEIVDIVSTISRMQKSIRFAAITSECNHCKTDGLFCVIYSLLRFTTMLYTSDLSRNCVAFAYPNICKRAVFITAQLYIKNLLFKFNFLIYFFMKINSVLNVDCINYPTIKMAISYKFINRFTPSIALIVTTTPNLSPTPSLGSNRLLVLISIPQFLFLV